MVKVEALVFNAFQVNTYLVSDSQGNCLVVDPAFYTPDEADYFDRYIMSQGMKVGGQVNTHCHVDHVLGVRHLRNKYGCKLRAHQNESALLNNVPMMGEVFGLQVEPLEGIEEILNDQDEIPVGDSLLRAIMVPGHSPGSLAFYSEEGGFVVTGDVLFQGSIGRTDLPGGDYDTLIRSIREKLLCLPPETIVYPGHGEPTSIAVEARENPFLTMAE